jgi:hypothetical protein
MFSHQPVCPRDRVRRFEFRHFKNKIDLQKRNALKNGVLFLVSPFIWARTATHQQTHQKPPKKEPARDILRETRALIFRISKSKLTNYQTHSLYHSLRPPTPAPPLPRNATFASPSLSRLQIPASIIPVSHVMSFSSHLLSLSLFYTLLRFPFSFTSGVSWI